MSQVRVGRSQLRLPRRLPLATVATAPYRTVSLSVARCGLAAGLMHFYLSNYQDRRFLWGTHGVLAQAPWTGHDNLVGSVSPHHLWRGEIGFEVLFHLALLLTLAFGLFGGRLLSAANWFMLTGLHGQNPLLLDGGDNLLRLLLFFMTLTDNNLYLAVGAVRRRSRFRQRLGHRSGSTRFFVHNCGVLLMVFQVVVLYSAAVLWKLSGEPWRDGTALYYVFQASEFTYRPLRFVVENPVLVTLLTYGVILSQMAIVWFALSRRRPFVVLGTALVLHAGIAVSMGLVTFSVVILSAVAVLVGDAAWMAVFSVVVQLLSSPRPNGSPTGVPHPWPVPTVAPAPVPDVRSQPGNGQAVRPVRWNGDEGALVQRWP